MKDDLSFALFDTAIGYCAIVWNSRGVAGVRFPEANEQATRKRIAQRHPSAREAQPSAQIASVIDDIVALLRGERRDLRNVAIDTDGIPDFNRRVYEIARSIPPGSTLSYGEIAERLGDRTLARDVGQALGENSIPIIVPCHRVLAAGGKTGGFSAPGGVAAKLRLLSIEGAQPGGPTLFDKLPLAVNPQSRKSA